MWMKWHHKFAEGPGEAEWFELSCSSEAAASLAEETAQELAQQYHWSDKYRGVAYELVEIPPAEVIQAHLHNAEKTVKHYQARVLELRNLLKEAGKESPC